MAHHDNQNDIEALKQLKARYCRLLDAKDWTAWRGIFADDLVLIADGGGGTEPTRLEGADTAVAALSTILNPIITVHQCHTPEIELTGADSARGTWAMEDLLVYPAGSPVSKLQGYGHYHETYVRRTGRWYIQTLELTRLHVIFT